MSEEKKSLEANEEKKAKETTGDTEEREAGTLVRVLPFLIGAVVIAYFVFRILTFVNEPSGIDDQDLDAFFSDTGTTEERQNAPETAINNEQATDSQPMDQSTNPQAAARINYDELVDDADFHINMGLAYLNQGLYEQSIFENKQAIRIVPEYGSAYNNLGYANYLMGKYDEAIKWYEDGLKVEPDSLHLRGNIEYCLQEALKKTEDPEKRQVYQEKLNSLQAGRP